MGFENHKVVTRDEPIDLAKSAHDEFLDILIGMLIDKGFCVVNPENTYEEILVVSTKNIRETIEQFKFQKVNK